MEIIKKFFLFIVGHTYSNLSRLFLRLFAGIMFLQFGIRQIFHYNEIATGYAGFMGMSPEASLSFIVAVELLCATGIILGLLTRIALIPAFALMCYIESILLDPASTDALQHISFAPGYPVMFMGIFMYMFLAGPGKISVDYLIAVHLDRDREEDEILEEA